MPLDNDFAPDSLVGQMLRQQRAATPKVAAPKPKAVSPLRRIQPATGYQSATSVLQQRLRQAGVE